MPITTSRDKLRLHIGDRDTAHPLFTDDELDVYLAARADNVLMSAADCCEALAIRFSSQVDFETDGQKVSRMKRGELFAGLAKQLRERATGIAVVPTTRVDGYSDDRDTHAGAGQGTRTGRVNRGYYDPDLPY